MSFIEDSWIAHTKGKYPREFASPNRLHNPVKNNDMFVKLVKAYAPAHNCFCSVYSFDNWERVLRHNKDVLVYENAIIDCLLDELCELVGFSVTISGPDVGGIEAEIFKFEDIPIELVPGVLGAWLRVNATPKKIQPWVVAAKAGWRLLVGRIMDKARANLEKQ